MSLLQYSISNPGCHQTPRNNYYYGHSAASSPPLPHQYDILTQANHIQSFPAHQNPNRIELPPLRSLSIGASVPVGNINPPQYSYRTTSLSATPPPHHTNSFGSDAKASPRTLQSLKLPSLLNEQPQMDHTLRPYTPSASPADSCSAFLSSPTVMVMDQTSLKPDKSRRQRLGPSCDSCRLRKVKCNAEITVLSHEELLVLTQQAPSLFQRAPPSSEDKYQVMGGFPGAVGFLLIQVFSSTENKFIKFKSCKACSNKKIDCLFSHGYVKTETKTDSVSIKFMSPPSSTISSPVTSAAVLEPFSVTKKAKVKKKRTKKLARALSVAEVSYCPSPSSRLILDATIYKPAVLVASICNATMVEAASTLASFTALAVRTPCFTSDETQKKRSLSACSRKSSCLSCRKRKIKCEFVSDGVNATCSNCFKKGRECVIESVRFKNVA
ncbi:hypothetical protein BABINDRAFT_7774 [Babjeviella inositovora NRRL Y-12698]|uniref:Zn(2)-C6 fungal-type domain-containing protein n=1 Tax=Babjeviella inositovora NRRL Y-12698 TaxID=984486 RepID=A0A1E3QRK8_9ASCO|nr:uncharacterized protein BABINDRAFT_7774 [Babjeviella inositovora NRRL Y-12698]ODQ80333.1 hypothetical protein BABINDRAFT_7774 [Babjeviella inositovora NRRL Y-12698]